MAKVFEEVKGNLGFGFMRLPLVSEETKEIDYEAASEMADAFIEHGFNYFDVAHGYHDEKAEDAIKRCLTSRHPRESYILTNKLSDAYFDSEEDIRAFFEKQLEDCGVEYFDFYLMHAQDRIFYEKYKKHRAYEIAQEFKAAGKVKHVGLSFHDHADVLDMILTEHPEVEVVQLQVNYLDYDSESVQSRLCLEVCKKHGKPVVVMEPVKGGFLANVPDEVRDALAEAGDNSPASMAVRFAASCDGVYMTLSGMGSLDQLNDNCSQMKEFEPLNDEERAAINKAVDIFSKKSVIPCTGCRYCTKGCPKGIDIPALFSCVNTKELSGGWNATYYYIRAIRDKGLAKDCIGCGACEAICPQHLNIRELLANTAESFAKHENNEEERRKNG